MVWVGQEVSNYRSPAYPAVLLSGLPFCHIRPDSRESTVFHFYNSVTCLYNFDSTQFIKYATD